MVAEVWQPYVLDTTTEKTVNERNSIAVCDGIESSDIDLKSVYSNVDYDFDLLPLVRSSDFILTTASQSSFSSMAVPFVYKNLIIIGDLLLNASTLTTSSQIDKKYEGLTHLEVSEKNKALTKDGYRVQCFDISPDGCLYALVYNASTKNHLIHWIDNDKLTLKSSLDPLLENVNEPYTKLRVLVKNGNLVNANIYMTNNMLIFTELGIGNDHAFLSSVDVVKRVNLIDLGFVHKNNDATKLYYCTGDNVTLSEQLNVPNQIGVLFKPECYLVKNSKSNTHPFLGFAFTDELKLQLTFFFFGGTITEQNIMQSYTLEKEGINFVNIVNQPESDNMFLLGYKEIGTVVDTYHRFEINLASIKVGTDGISIKEFRGPWRLGLVVQGLDKAGELQEKLRRVSISASGKGVITLDEKHVIVFHVADCTHSDLIRQTYDYNYYDFQNTDDNSSWKYERVFRLYNSGLLEYHEGDGLDVIFQDSTNGDKKVEVSYSVKPEAFESIDQLDEMMHESFGITSPVPFPLSFSLLPDGKVRIKVDDSAYKTKSPLGVYFRDASRLRQKLGFTHGLKLFNTTTNDAVGDNIADQWAGEILQGNLLWSNNFSVGLNDTTCLVFAERELRRGASKLSPNGKFVLGRNSNEIWSLRVNYINTTTFKDYLYDNGLLGQSYKLYTEKYCYSLKNRVFFNDPRCNCFDPEIVGSRVLGTNEYAKLTSKQKMKTINGFFCNDYYCSSVQHFDTILGLESERRGCNAQTLIVCSMNSEIKMEDSTVGGNINSNQLCEVNVDTDGSYIDFSTSTNSRVALENTDTENSLKLWFGITTGITALLIISGVVTVVLVLRKMKSNIKKE